MGGIEFTMKGSCSNQLPENSKSNHQDKFRALEMICEAAPIGLIALDDKERFFIFNRTAEQMLGVNRSDYFGRSMAQVADHNRLFSWLSLRRPFHDYADRVGEISLKVSCVSLGQIGDGGNWIFFMEDVTRLSAVSMELRRAKNLNDEIQSTLESSYDELFVFSAEGTVLNINNQAAERFYGMKANEIIGRNVKEMEEAGIFYPSTAEMVLKTKARFDTIQHTITGKVLMVTANPVLDSLGNVVRVVSNSRDLTELNELSQKLELSERMNRQYRSELNKLKYKKEFLKDVIAYSLEMQRSIGLAEKLAGVDSTVLILGESGVGKDVIARLIHRLSNRRNASFVEVNCGAIPEALLESELFGYEPGAFTGANKEGKLGQIELAKGGTLFLDEIAELSLILQVKLLKVIQDRKVIRVGGPRPFPVDLRIIAATNKDLRTMVNEGKFREDLYYRLNVIPIEIKPLRQRREDIAPMAYFFLERINKRYGMDKKISPGVMDLLLDFQWPGNVRQLENLIERLVVTSDGIKITVGDLPPEFHAGHEGKTPRVMPTGIMPLKEAVAQLESELIKMALEKHKTAEAAGKVLGVHPTTLMRKYKKRIEI